MALSKRKLIKRNIFKGFGTVQLHRHHYLNTTAWRNVREYEQKILSSKHQDDTGALYHTYVELHLCAQMEYDYLLMQWANGTESKYALTRY